MKHLHIGLLILAVGFSIACGAKPKPVAYVVTVVSASIEPEKAPGVTWDVPEQDETLLAEGCGIVSPALTGAAIGSVLPGIGTAVGALVGGLISLFTKKGCDSLIVKANPAAPLPDPLMKLEAGDVLAAPPPMQNTANPIWNVKFEFQYQKRLKILVFLYDIDEADGDEADGEPIGTCILKPGKAEGTIQMECGQASVLFDVTYIYDKSVSAVGGHAGDMT